MDHSALLPHAVVDKQAPLTDGFSEQHLPLSNGSSTSQIKNEAFNDESPKASIATKAASPQSPLQSTALPHPASQLTSAESQHAVNPSPVQVPPHFWSEPLTMKDYVSRGKFDRPPTAIFIPPTNQLTSTGSQHTANQSTVQDPPYFWSEPLKIKDYLAKGQLNKLPLPLRVYASEESVFEERRRLVRIIVEKREFETCNNIEIFCRQPCLEEEAVLLVVLRENTQLTWNEVALYFPGRQISQLQALYDNFPGEELGKWNFRSTENSKHHDEAHLVMLRKLAQGRFEDLDIFLNENDKTGADECKTLLRITAEARLQTTRAKYKRSMTLNVEERALVALLWERTSLDWQGVANYAGKANYHHAIMFAYRRDMINKQRPLFHGGDFQRKNMNEYAKRISDFNTARSPSEESVDEPKDAEEMEESSCNNDVEGDHNSLEEAEYVSSRNSEQNSLMGIEHFSPLENKHSPPMETEHYSPIETEHNSPVASENDPTMETDHVGVGTLIVARRQDADGVNSSDRVAARIWDALQTVDDEAEREYLKGIYLRLQYPASFRDNLYSVDYTWKGTL